MADDYGSKNVPDFSNAFHPTATTASVDWGSSPVIHWGFIVDGKARAATPDEVKRIEEWVSNLDD